MQVTGQTSSITWLFSSDDQMGLGRRTRRGSGLRAVVVGCWMVQVMGQDSTLRVSAVMSITEWIIGLFGWVDSGVVVVSN
jgi:hypothetical protein